MFQVSGMPTHAEQRILPYTPEQMFDLVADVEKYPQFLPWCSACRIRKREGNVILADLAIGYKMLKEKFTSRVDLQRPHHIRVDYLDGPLKHLSNTWDFYPTDDGGCLIDFYVDFEFRSRILQRLMEMFFNEAVKRMVTAFETRAGEIYGPAGPQDSVSSTASSHSNP